MRIRVAVTILFLLTNSAVFGQDAPKKVTRAEAMSAATAKPQPSYPPAARQLKIEGTVEVEAVVTESGTVEKVNIISGNPVLTKPAADAVKQWKFSPFTAGGKAVRAVAPLSFTFKL